MIMLLTDKHPGHQRGQGLSQSHQARLQAQLWLRSLWNHGKGCS